MLVSRPVLDAEGVRRIRAALADEEWSNGLIGTLDPSSQTDDQKEYSQTTKLNEEIRVEHNQHLSPLIQNLAKAIGASFSTTVFPDKVLALRFNRYHDGGTYRTHSDGACQATHRSDVSCTLFLSDPDTYEGGELVIIGSGGIEMPFKLPAGQAIAYPSYFLHHVNPVTSGERIAAVCWMKSMYRDSEQRHIMSELWNVRKALKEGGRTDEFLSLVNVQNNLQRMWME